MNNIIRKAYTSFRKNLVNYKKIDWLHNQIWNDYKSSKVNLGQLQSAANCKKSISRLSEVEFQVFSQFGDDGIIQWLISQLPIPNKTFIEFGVENYREANTRFLLINNYWSGLVIDGSAHNIDSIKGEQIFTFYDLQAECSFITRHNINDIINSAKFKEEVGILSIDIDGNDYWIWEAIKKINPIIVISEYNSLFGFEHPYTIHYEDDFVRGKKYPFNFYGTSLRSAYDLAESRGYSFIGCNSAGNNAYFIRKDYVSYLNISVLEPVQGYTFASFTEAWSNSGLPLRGIDKVMSINNLPVVNTLTGKSELVDSQSIVSSLIKNNKLARY